MVRRCVLLDKPLSTEQRAIEEAYGMIGFVTRAIGEDAPEPIVSGILLRLNDLIELRESGIIYRDEINDIAWNALLQWVLGFIQGDESNWELVREDNVPIGEAQLATCYSITKLPPTLEEPEQEEPEQERREPLPPEDDREPQVPPEREEQPPPEEDQIEPPGRPRPPRQPSPTVPVPDEPIVIDDISEEDIERLLGELDVTVEVTNDVIVETGETIVNVEVDNTGILEGLEESLGEIIDAQSREREAQIDFWGGVISDLIDSITTPFEPIIEGIGDILVRVGEGLEEAVYSIGNVIDEAYRIASELIANLTDTILVGFEMVVDTLTSLFNAYTEFIALQLKALNTILESIISFEPDELVSWICQAIEVLTKLKNECKFFQGA